MNSRRAWKGQNLPAAGTRACLFVRVCACVCAGVINDMLQEEHAMNTNTIKHLMSSRAALRSNI